LKRPISIIENAIGLSPDSPLIYFISNLVLPFSKTNFNEAEKNINQAIELDPYDADYFALLANIKLGRKHVLKKHLKQQIELWKLMPKIYLALKLREVQP
jgi:tetratricopeptide (TPR) repeat protein